MKKVILAAVLSFTFAANGFSQTQVVCRPGITYKISTNANWGKDRPVVTGIAPFSSAENSTIEVSDIIMSIDGADTENLSADEIDALLNPSGKENILLVVKNIANPEKQVMIKKQCKRANVITEEQLASAFNMFSLETEAERPFVCPFKTFVTPDRVDFTKYKTFAFTAADDGNEDLEDVINQSIELDLQRKGLTVDVDNPDIIVQTFYYLDKNPNFKGVNKIVTNKENNYRYDYEKNTMDKVPFLASSTPESEAAYLLQFGYRLVDQKEKQGRILWECEANELLDNPYKLEEYAKLNVPLMGMQYPMVKYERSLPIVASMKAYNYTGLNYDIEDLTKVVSVDKNSPAAEAGFKVGDVIEAINGINLEGDAGELSNDYKSFISKTMPLRNQETRFTDANGFPSCMFWDVSKYSDVASAVKKSDSGAFSYLYYYAPYVNPSGNNTCVFDIKRGKQKFKISVQPVIKRSMRVELK
jgi:hypothetical protein